MPESLIPYVFFPCILISVIHFFKGWNSYNKMLDELDRKHLPMLFIVPLLIFFKGQHTDKGDVHRRQLFKHVALSIVFALLPFIVFYTVDAWKAGTL